MPRHTNKNNQIGFTLIEVLVTVFLISATLILYHGTAKTVTINSWNKYREIALRIADNKMQTLRSSGYSSLPTTGAFTDNLLSSIPGGTGTVTVTDLNPKTKDVVVTVTWNSPSGNGTQEVRLETYINQLGLGQ